MDSSKSNITQFLSTWHVLKLAYQFDYDTYPSLIYFFIGKFTQAPGESWTHDLILYLALTRGGGAVLARAYWYVCLLYHKKYSLLLSIY